jgi:hypothetical protein
MNLCSVHPSYVSNGWPFWRRKHQREPTDRLYKNCITQRRFTMADRCVWFGHRTWCLGQSQTQCNLCSCKE